MSESFVTSMDSSPPFSSVHGFPSKNTGVGAISFSKKTSKRLFLGAFLKILKQKRTLMPINKKTD